MLGNGNGSHLPPSRPPNTRRPGQTSTTAANHHHQNQIQIQNQNHNQNHNHNQHLYPPSAGPQGYAGAPRSNNMNPPSSAAGARNRQHQNQHAPGSHHPVGTSYPPPPPVAAAASNEHYPAYPQHQQHPVGSSAAGVQYESPPSNSQQDTQDDVQELDREDTITPNKVGTLICVKGGKKSVIDLTPREYTIGRSVDCDVVLTSLECSKRHCRIFVLAEPSQQPQVEGAPACVWMIQDLSTNGTFVNGKRIPKNQPLPLYSGDLLEIKVGNHFEFSSLHAMYPDPNEDLKDPEYPTVHNQYLLTRKLGSGTYATVYLTQELSTGRRFACKVVNKRKAGLSERQTNNKLVQEIEVIRHFNHPNIIRVHNYIETRLYLYVVMDLAQSGELFDYLAAQYGIEETKCKLIMYQIFKGLKYLHENKVVHRDIKPENILLDFSGEFPRVMLADFGLAKRRNTEGPERMTTLCGTLNYLAPEVINPPVRAQGYDDVVDCWAAGIMLFFLLTCRHPFDDDNDTALKNKILRGPLTMYAPTSDGRNLFDHLSSDVADLIQKLLARDPAQRLTAEAALKHPWFTSSNSDLKTAYKAVHESWEAHAHRAPQSALTTAKPISAGELFTQSQAGPSQEYEEDEQESDVATMGVSVQQPWVPDECADDAMDEDAPGSLQGAAYPEMPPASASLLPGQFASSQSSQLHHELGEFASQFGAAGGTVFSQQPQQQHGRGHGYGHGHLTVAPLDRQRSVIPPPGHGSSPPPAGGSSFIERQSSMSQPGPSGPAHLQAHTSSNSPTQYQSKFAANMSNFMSQQSQQHEHQHAGPFSHEHSGLQQSSSFSESWSQSQGQSYAHQGGFSAAGRYTGTPYPSFGAGPAPVQGSNNMPPVPQFNHGNGQQQRQQQQQQQQFSSGYSGNQL